MKRRITSWFLLGLMCLIGVNAVALDQKDGVYQIGTAQDLADFAALVETGDNKFGGANQANAILTADIDYTGQTAMIGENVRYYGTFDGNGHTVTVSFKPNGAGCALIRYNYGEIHNLCVKGTIETAFSACAGIAAYNYGLVENCVSLVDIVSSKDGDNTSGGIVAQSYAYGVIRNCVFAGSIKGEAATNCGGIVGWLNGNTVIENCLAIGDIDITKNTGSNAIARYSQTNGTIINCYYKDGWWGTVDTPAAGDAPKAVTEDMLKSGEIAYALGMNQVLNTDAYPTPLGTAKVYATTSDCAANTASGFTNTEVASTHTFAGDTCSLCGAVNENFLQPVNGVYQLGSVADVTWFAKMVNAGHMTLNAVLTADIDFAGVTDFPMIGTEVHPFYGEFDGQFHQIKNLVIDLPEATNVGFFSCVAGCGIVRNLTADAGCSFYAKSHVGFIGHTAGLGFVTLSKIGNQGKVGAVPQIQGGSGDAGVGGIVGNCNTGGYGTIEYCWFNGQILSGSSASFISGWCGGNQFSMKGCWAVADMPDPLQSNLMTSTCLARVNNNGFAAFENCAVVSKDAEGNYLKEAQAATFNADQVTSGELCWHVNGQSYENPVWFQKLNSDAIPVLNGTDVVYKVGTKNCDGTDGDGFGFSNANTGFSQTPHQLDADGFCTVCGKLGTDEDGYFLVGTAKALKWIANYVNDLEGGRGTRSTQVNFRLTADIDLGGEMWTPIGKDDNCWYMGNFDGGRHTISNMKVDVDGPAGFFGSVGGGTFCDVYIDATCDVRGTQWSGGLIGRSYTGRVDITNVGTSCKVSNSGTGNSGAAAGIIGNANSGSICNMTRCFSTGTLSAGKDLGMLSAWEGSVGAVIKDCWSTAEVPAGTNMCRGTVTYENCYATENVVPVAGISADITAEMLATGELCYKLNGLQESIVWYQTLESDATPVPWDNHMRVYGNGALNCDGSAAGGVLTYSNTPGDNNEIPPHTYEGGFCNGCGGLDENYMKPDGGFYMLASAKDLHWFVSYVNAKPNDRHGLNAKLTADVDLTEVEGFLPLLQFSGIFDGQGHTIDGFNFTASDKDAGFVRVGLSNLTIKNVIFGENTFIRTDDYGAGIVGGSLSGQTGTLTLSNVGFEGTVQAGNSNAAGLIGSNHGSTAKYVFKNCYVRGSMTGEGAGESAAFSGWAGPNAEVHNCWTDATISGVQEGREAIRYSSLTVTNSYMSVEMNSTQLPTFTQDDIASGALTWKLNGETFLDAKWYQTVGSDEKPVWDATRGLVYKNGEDSYESVVDEDSYNAFRDYVLNNESSKLGDIVAYTALKEAYETSLGEMEDIATLNEFLEAYSELVPQQNAISTSAKLYADYKAVCEEIEAYLVENDLQCDERNVLDVYLSESVEPNETYPNGTYNYIMETALLNDSVIVAEAEFAKSLLNAAVAADYKAGTEITTLLANASLAEGFDGWTVEGTPTAGGVKDVMPAAEAYSTVFSVTQTVEGLKDGIYKMSVNAAFRPYGDLISTMYAGALVMNGNMNYAMVENEDLVLKGNEVDSVNCLLTGNYKDYTYVNGDVEGYVPMGPIGCSFAFNAGRYLNHIAVEVTDGKLTLGVENPGTGLTRDWMGFGNFRLTYLGTAEEAADGLTEVLDGYVARANVIQAFIHDSTTEFTKYPNFSNALKEQLNEAITAAASATEGADKMALINKFSEIFKQIYECRMIYAQMMLVATNMENSLSTFLDQSLIDDEQYNAAMEKVDAIYAAYDAGSVSVEEAKAMMEALNNNGVLPPVVNGAYQIASVKDLQIFATLVNAGQTNINGTLTADLDFSGVENFAPIGFNLADENATDASANTYAYSGTFDGQGHRISNLTVNYPNSIGVGLFGTITTPAVIKGIVLDATCSIVGKDRAGLVGRGNNAGVITLSRLGNEGSVSANVAPAGILGNANAGSIAYIDNCYSSGTITASNNNAAMICGWFGGTSPLGKAVNCWSIADISGQDSDERVFCRINSTSTTFINNYSIKDGSGFMSAVTPKELFANGSVTYALNEYAGENIWFQNIGTDAHPVFDSTHQIVYKKDDGTYYNDGNTAIEEVEGTIGDTMNVYDVQGRKVRAAVSTKTGMQGLPQGMYILKGQSKTIKVLVK